MALYLKPALGLPIFISFSAGYGCPFLQYHKTDSARLTPFYPNVSPISIATGSRLQVYMLLVVFFTEPSFLFCQGRLNIKTLTEISSVLLPADSLKIRRSTRYGGAVLDLWSGIGACLIIDVADVLWRSKDVGQCLLLCTVL